MNEINLSNQVNQSTGFDGKVTEIGVFEGANIYRYLPIERFLDMIEKKQNVLAHISMWEDPNEAYLIRANIAHGHSSNDNELIRQWYDQYRTMYGQSWMFTNKESDVLWRAYGKRGETVRISTTVQNLIDSVKCVITNKDIRYDLSGYVGAITYSDDMSDSVQRDGIDIIKTLFVKPKEFSDENEFRLVIKASESGGVLESYDKADCPSLYVEKGLLKYQIADLSRFIQSVLVDPACTNQKLDEIHCRVLNAGYDFSVYKSSLFDWPSCRRSTIPMTREFESKTANRTELPERRFWSLFKDAYKEKESIHFLQSIPSRRYWSISLGKGMFYTLIYNNKFARVELYIDSPDKEWNKKEFNRISSSLKEKYPNSSFSYDELPTRRASRITIVNEGFKFSDDDSQWSGVIEWLCTAFTEFKKKVSEFLPDGVGL